MSFVIHWVENCSGAEDVTKIQTPAGQLVLYSRQGVISKANWSLITVSVRKTISYKDSSSSIGMTPIRLFTLIC